MPHHPIFSDLDQFTHWWTKDLSIVLPDWCAHSLGWIFVGTQHKAIHQPSTLILWESPC